jgi:hypothetical protein
MAFYINGGINVRQPKYDGIIQAVRYGEDGQILWVRAFLRRGSTWSDHVLIERHALIAQMKSGKHFVAGERIPLEASTFKNSAPMKLVQKDGSEILVAGEIEADRDCLEGVPLI